jgi:hypothetical protein
VGSTLPNGDSSQLITFDFHLDGRWLNDEQEMAPASASSSILATLHLVSVLLQQNTTMRRRSDLLLPRLMSGKVEV